MKFVSRRRLGLIMAAMLVPSMVTAQQAKSVSIVAFGDSLTAGYGLPPEDAFTTRLEARLRELGLQAVVANAGVSGDTTKAGLQRIDWSIPDGTGLVVLELGANDALRGISPAETRLNLDAMLLRLKQRGIPVLLAGMLAPPNMGRDYEAEFNAIYPALAEKHSVPLYPFFLNGVASVAELNQADGMHPNAAGTMVIVEQLAPVVAGVIKKLSQ
jgi:acyl-CoA thioesterase-1